MTTNPTSAERSVESVAAGLTRAQKEVLATWGSAEPFHHWSVANLIAKGLLDYRRRWFLVGGKGVYITGLGKKVRAHLTASEKKG